MTDDNTNTETDEPAPDFIGDDHPGQTHVVPDADPANSDGELVEEYRRARIEAGDAPPAERVERTDRGGSIEATFKRGTGTRDEDKWRIKGKGATAGEAIRHFERELEAVEEELAERVRNLQVEIDEGESDAE